MKYQKKSSGIYLWITGVFALALLVFFIGEPWTMISKAASQYSTRLGIPSNIQPPYVRLSVSPVSYTVGQKIPVDVYLHTGGMPTTETVISATFDPAYLSFTDQDITNAGVYPVINKESAGDGRIVFSLFTDANLENPTVSLSGERVVAHLVFTAMQTTSEETPIELILDKTIQDTSGIYGVRTNPDVPIQNIISHVGNVSIRIER